MQATAPDTTPDSPRDRRMSFRFAAVASMMAACGSLSATTFTRVDLPDPVSEASSGVNIVANTYTHAINFGNGSTTDVDINGLLFDTKNLTATVTDDNRAGNTISAAVTTGTLGNNAGNSGVKAAAGDMKTVMQPFAFHSGASTGTMSFTINNLTPGTPYFARFYGYQWDSTAAARTLQISSNLDSDTADIDWGAGTQYRCFYIEVSYTPSGTSAQINFKALDSGNGAHISAITNHTAVAPVKWSGTASAIWNDADLNFTGQSFSAFKLSGGSKVIFADTDGNSIAPATTTLTVDPAGVSIADVDFVNTTGVTYSIDADGGSGITGTTNINKTGTGAVSLLGQHSYTGNTTVAAGTLTLDTAFLADGSTVSINTGATLNLTHSDNDFVNGLTLNGVPQLNGVYDSTTSAGFLTGSGKIVVFSGGLIRWTGAAADLSWATVGNWNIPLVPNSNLHNADFSFDAPASETIITLDGSKTIGTLKFDDTSATADGDLKFVAGISDPSSTLTASTVNITDAGRTITLQTGNAIPMILTKNGSGTLVIKDDTTTRGGTLTATGGTLRLQNSTGLSTLSTNGLTLQGGAVVESDALVGGTWPIGTLLIGQSGTGTLVNKNGSISVAATVDVAVGNSTNANGTIRIEGGTMAFAKGTGSMEWIMIGRDPQAPGVQTGRIYLQGGTLETSRSLVGSGSNTSTDYLAEVYLDGGTLKAESGVPVNATYGWLQASANGNALPLSGVYVRDAGAIFDTNGGDVLIAAALTEDVSQPGGGLTKQGLGTLTLSGPNTYAGNTTVTGGVLSIATDDVLSDTSTVTLANSASLVLTHAGTDIVGALVIGGVPQGNGVYPFGSGSLQVGTSTPFQAWALSKGLDGTAGKENGPADDPDKDGKTNLAEFAFNGDPLSGSDNGKVFVLTADTDADTTKELILTIAVRSGAAAFTGTPSPASSVDGVTYTINGSVNLSTFATQVNVVAPQTAGLPPAGAGYEYRSFSLEGSDGLSGKGFLRAIVTN
jgi:autotransporter-associated beta strand protein